MSPQPLAAGRGTFDQAMQAAVTHHQAGRFDQAERFYDEALKIDWANADALRLLGGLYIQKNQHERAVKTLRQALQVAPQNAEIHNSLGIALRNQGQIAEAIDCFEQALRHSPTYVEAYNNLGHAHFSQGKFNTAIALYEKALLIKPDFTKALCNLGSALRDAGRLPEAVERQQQALKIQPNDPDLLHDFGLTMQRMNKLEDALHCYKQALRFKPDFFAAQINLGSALRDIGRTDEAFVQYEKAMRMAPDRAEVFVNLGAVFWDMNKPEKAIACYEQALRLKPDYDEALVNLGSVLWVMGRPDEALERYEAALRIKPDHASAISNMGSLRHDKADLDGALDLYEKALRINPHHPHARFGKSLVLLAYGQYREGWMHYEAGLGIRLLRGINRFPGKPWNGTPIPGKRLVIWSEQGLGDSLQFIRYAPLCKEKAGKIIVLCPVALARLFKNNPAIDEVRQTINGDEFDEHIAMMSLPYAFGTTVETIPSTVPYLSVPSDAATKWAPKFAGIDGLKVGLVWAGNARENQANANLLDRRRSISLDRLRPLFDVPNVRFVNLQMGKTTPQIDAFGFRDRIIDPMGEVEDFVDTAAIINTLDLVITVDTSVAHLAGALGKPVWILSRYDACWRWLRNREDSPWYPTARIFGQPSFGDWDSVIERVREALAAEAAWRNGG